MKNTTFGAVLLAAILALSLAGCGGGSSTPPPDPVEPPPDPAIAQRADIMTAIEKAKTAVPEVDNDSTDSEVSAAEEAISGARTAIAAGANVPAEESKAYTGTVDTLEAQLTAAKSARMTAMDDAQKAANAAMASLAKALYGGIGTAPLNGHTVTIAAATGLPSVDPNGALTNQALTADKKTAVAANHGWKGTRYTASGTNVSGTYEAVVYANADDPTPGDKFSTQYTDNLSGGVLDTGTTEGNASLVDSPSFDQSAGVKSFKLGDNLVAVKISGSFHGVSGTYSCVPGGTEYTCAVRKAAQGFTLGAVSDADNDPTTPVVFSTDNGTWTFKPSDPDDLVMSSDDTVYATYGWWLHTAEDGTLTASAFAVDRGTVPNASIGDLASGTATYKGGAAGHYALRSSTGGTNDAGQFTADAMLEADFGDDTITGTIDGFMGGDGKARNWSVELKEATMTDVGVISRTAADDTAWTIGETTADASGEWSGSLQDNGADGVPKVATGTFHSTFGVDGRMVGSFGANKTDD